MSVINLRDMLDGLNLPGKVVDAKQLALDLAARYNYETREDWHEFHARFASADEREERNHFADEREAHGAADVYERVACWVGYNLLTNRVVKTGEDHYTLGYFCYAIKDLDTGCIAPVDFECLLPETGWEVKE